MKEVKIKLDYDLLKYDIENCAFIEGENLGDDAAVAKRNIQDIFADGNKDRVARVIDMAVCTARELLYPYCVDGTIGTDYSNSIGESAEIVFNLNIPDTVASLSVDLLRNAVHEYIVCAALSDWLSLVMPARAETWTYKATDAARNVRQSINIRNARVRRRAHPF